MHLPVAPSSFVCSLDCLDLDVKTEDNLTWTSLALHFSAWPEFWLFTVNWRVWPAVRDSVLESVGFAMSLTWPLLCPTQHRRHAREGTIIWGTVRLAVTVEPELQSKLSRVSGFRCGCISTQSKATVAADARILIKTRSHGFLLYSEAHFCDTILQSI